MNLRPAVLSSIFGPSLVPSGTVFGVIMWVVLPAIGIVLYLISWISTIVYQFRKSLYTQHHRFWLIATLVLGLAGLAFYGIGGPIGGSICVLVYWLPGPPKTQGQP
jgi:hypothetical protein